MLIKSKDIIGLKVLTLSKGEKIDNVKDIIFDPATNRIAALLVDNKGWVKDAKVILFEDINSIGEDAVMVNSVSVIKKAKDVESTVKKIARDHDYLTGDRIVTEDGKDLGKIVDLYFDSTTGVVTDFEVSQGAAEDVKSGKKKVKIGDIVTVGKDATIVKSYTVVDFKQQSEDGGLQGKLADAKNKGKEIVSKTKDKANEANAKLQTEIKKPETQNTFQSIAESANEMINDATNKIQDVGNKAAEKINQAKEDKVAEKTANKMKDKLNEAAEKVSDKAQDLKFKVEDKTVDIKNDFQNRQDAQVAGKYLTRDILTPMDKVFARRGDMVTHDMLMQADDLGLRMMIVSNVTDQPPMQQ